MSASAVYNRVAHLIAAVVPGARADAVLRDKMAVNRYLSPAEQTAMVEAFWQYFRWEAWLNTRDSIQVQLATAAKLQARFDTNPSSFKIAALAARAVPNWLVDEMTEIPPGWLQQLQRPPALWLRTRRELTTQVIAELAETEPVPDGLAVALPQALRYAGRRDLFRQALFQAGAFEIQDLSSQLVGLAAAPQPGETWWDTCAGEGGKTLHLADLMHNQGMIWATDRHSARLERLKTRAARAKMFNYRTAAWEGTAQLPTKTKFDGILIDAPCSGLGTWQRNPHARWTTGPTDITQLAAIQRDLLEHALPALKPGGKLVYAVCTLTRRETTDLAAAFTAAHPELTPEPIFDQVGTYTVWPHEWNANGMFIAAWRKA